MSLMPQQVMDVPDMPATSDPWTGLLQADAQATTAATVERLPHPRPDVDEHVIEGPLAPIIAPSPAVDTQLAIRDRLPAVRTDTIDLLEGEDLLAWLGCPDEMPGDAPLMDLKVERDQRLFPLVGEPDDEGPIIVCDVITPAEHDESCPGGEPLYTDAEGHDGAPTWLCITCHQAVLL